MDRIEISEAIPQDYTVIQQIAHKTWPITYGRILSKAQLHYMLDLFYSIDAITISVGEKGHHLLLAKDGNTPVGFASYEHHYPVKGKTKIHKIYVLPETQGKGIGKLILEKVGDIAIQNHNSILSLNVNRENKAVHFYTKLGFQIVGEEDIPIGHGYLMEDYIMEKQLIQIQ